jgi:hypothetical protein
MAELNNRRRRILHRGQDARVELGVPAIVGILQFDGAFQNRKRSAAGRKNAVRPVPENGFPVECAHVGLVELLIRRDEVLLRV